jgi:POT family proton-dependent oligopeptide transporter
VLAGTELWDRISWHGMVAMLVLYMTGELLLPGRVEHVVGFATYRAGLEQVFGPMSVTQLATQTFALYFSAITLLPLVGGWIGDKVMPRRAAVSLGALTMTAGHFAMAFDATFLLALVLLVIGAGLLRGNLMPQIARSMQPGIAGWAMRFRSIRSASMSARSSPRSPAAPWPSIMAGTPALPWRAWAC